MTSNRRDPGAMTGNQTYTTSRGPCSCSHGEVSHVLKPDKTRAACSVTDLVGTCQCRTYQERGPAPATAEEKLRRIWELHTDSIAGVCPSCATLPADVDDDGLVDWPCPTILVIDPEAGRTP